MPFLVIHTRDPLIFRDSRPFGSGVANRHYPIAWPLPQTVAGALRTWVGKLVDHNFPETLVNRLLSLSCRGPLALHQSKLLFPTPSDFLVDELSQQLFAMAPAKSEPALLPADLPQLALRTADAAPDFKPQRLEPWVTLSWITNWLSGLPAKPPALTNSAHSPSETEFRVHVAIDDPTGVAEDEKLFQTAGFILKPSYALAVALDSQDHQLLSALKHFPSLLPLGGERRLAWVEAGEARADDGWSCPTEIRDALRGKKSVRLVLATPAIFEAGWRPEWLNGINPVPGTKVVLKLRSAVLDRWQPVSGWSYDRKSFGEKALRRMAPAGSVYFCDVVSGDPAQLADVWLAPVSDATQDRADGFGLALWGTPYGLESHA